MPLKESYTLNLQMVCGLILEKDVGGSSTTGTGDYYYVNVNNQTVKGTIREVLFLGNLGYGARAGLRCANANAWSGWASWYIASRLSATSRSRG